MIRTLAQRIHPTTWWLLAIVLAVIAGTASALWQTAAIAATAVVLILAFREDAPWARSLKFYLTLAGAVILIRVAFRIVFSFSSDGEAVLFHLPALTLNLGLGEISLLGAISYRSILGALLDGSRLAAIILAIAIANTLANPKKLLKSAPGALYEIATSVSVAINLAPQLIESFNRVRRARSLRGRSRKTGQLAGLLIPVLEDTLDRSLLMAASMDARGFGRRTSQSAREVAIARTLGLLALLLNLIGIFILLSGFSTIAALGLLLAGLLAAAISVRLTSRRNSRTSIARSSRGVIDVLIYVVCALALVINFASLVRF
jgi:energy-coupling factor transport system permease protein